MTFRFCIKHLNLPISMIYKTTVKYQPVVFSEIIYIISEISLFQCKCYMLQCIYGCNFIRIMISDFFN